ncbi:MAG: hypothetical protein V1845_01095 [bacterium]
MSVFSLCDILEKRREELLIFATATQKKQEHEPLDHSGIQARAKFQAQIDIAEQYAQELEDLSCFVQTVHYSLVCSKFWNCLFILPIATLRLQKVLISDDGFPVLLDEIKLFLFQALPYFRAG